MIHREPANEHIRNALAILMQRHHVRLVEADLLAVEARLRKALAHLEDKRVDTRLSNGPRHGSVRRGNPSLLVLGANPRVTDAALATWAKIEYVRPDDPDGKRIVRVHEFADGFEIGWLSDGSVQLSHPQHPLWVDDKE